MSFFEKAIIAARPKTLPAAFAPVIIAYGLFWQNNTQANLKFLELLNILIAAILIQIISNLANDLYDFKKGADNANRLGPRRLLASNLATEVQVKIALIILVGLSVICGLPLVIQGGLPIMLIGIISIIFAFLYTAGPYPLAYLGLGELFVFIFFGPLATAGSYFIFTDTFSWLAIILGTIPGFFSATVLLSNNIRDRATDKLAHKNTISVKIGLKLSLLLHKCLLTLPAIIITVYSINSKNLLLLLLTLYLIPAWKIILSSNESSTSHHWNQILARTGMINIFFSIAFLIFCII